MQLNDLSRLRKFMGKTEKAAILNSFYTRIFTITFWCGIFVYASLLGKLKTLKNVALSFKLMTTKVVLKLQSGKLEPQQ